MAPLGEPQEVVDTLAVYPLLWGKCVRPTVQEARVESFEQIGVSHAVLVQCGFSSQCVKVEVAVGELIEVTLVNVCCAQSFKVRKEIISVSVDAYTELFSSVENKV